MKMVHVIFLDRLIYFFSSNSTNPLSGEVQSISAGGTFNCDLATYNNFDLSPNQQKQCQYILNNNPFTFCTAENGTCIIPSGLGPAEISFYSSQSTDPTINNYTGLVTNGGTITCSTDTFGGDPAPNQTKQCSYKLLTPGTPIPSSNILPVSALNGLSCAQMEAVYGIQPGVTYGAAASNTAIQNLWHNNGCDTNVAGTAINLYTPEVAYTIPNTWSVTGSTSNTIIGPTTNSGSSSTTPPPAVVSISGNILPASALAGLSCSEMESIYGIQPNVSWGGAASNTAIQNLWHNNGCDTDMTDTTLNAYSPGVSYVIPSPWTISGYNSNTVVGPSGTPPATSTANSTTNTLPASALDGLSCSVMGEVYGIIPNNTYGLAQTNTAIQNLWNNNSCNTNTTSTVLNPYAPGVSYTIPSPWTITGSTSNTVIGPPAGYPITSAPASPANILPQTAMKGLSCQLIAEMYGVTPTSWGSAPSSIQAMWTSGTCDSNPASTTLLPYQAGQSYTFPPSWGLPGTFFSNTISLPDPTNKILAPSAAYGLSCLDIAQAFEGTPAYDTDIQNLWSTGNCSPKPQDVSVYPYSSGTSFKLAPGWTINGSSATSVSRS